MRTLVAGILLMAGLVACAPQGSDVAGESFETAASATNLVIDLESWCAIQTPDRCIEAMVYLDRNPERDTCVFTSSDLERSFWELCEQAEPGVEPITTIPTAESEAQQRTAEQANEEEVARLLPVLDERAHKLLDATHPDGTVTTGLLFANPLDLAEVEQLAADAGAVLMAAWRTDYVCLPGLDDWPVDTASRFAFFDGVERAERLRVEMENSTTPVTGGSIARDRFAVTEQEAVALREPGVLLEAVRAQVPVAALETLRGDPRIDRVRLAGFPTEWIDLADLPVPDCEND